MWDAGLELLKVRLVGCSVGEGGRRNRLDVPGTIQCLGPQACWHGVVTMCVGGSVKDEQKRNTQRGLWRMRFQERGGGGMGRGTMRRF